MDPIDEFVPKLTDLIEEYSPRIDEDNLLGILIGFCLAIGEYRGYRKRDFKHKLKDIIDYKEKF